MTPVIHQRFRKVRFGWTVETSRYDEKGKPEIMDAAQIAHAVTWRGIQRKGEAYAPLQWDGENSPGSLIA